MRQVVVVAVAASLFAGAFRVADGGGTGIPCDPSYPTVCLPPVTIIGDLDCSDLDFGGFTVNYPDPHFLDPDLDGVGCEG